MKLDHILGKILALTKQIHLSEQPEGYIRKFFAGKSTLVPPIGQFGFRWWITKSGLTLCKEIANMAISFDSQLQGGDLESFSGLIERAFEENVVDKHLFSVDHIFFIRQTKTLFDGRAILNEKDFSLELWNKIKQTLERSMNNWLIIYPLQRVTVQSTKLEYDRISLLASDDVDTWRSISEQYPEATFWEPSSGKRVDTRDNFNFGKPPTWLLCEVAGTAAGARRLARRYIRTFIAVLFSHLHDKIPNLLTKSMAKEISYSIQFPIDSRRAGCGQEIGHIGSLLPPLITDINVSSEGISEINNWYKLRSLALKSLVQRAIAASHFIHYGIMADDLERFLHFFIALDALFGECDKVEKAIISGIERVFPKDLTWVQRVENLFDLRSEIVHGGVSLIDDWEGLDHYQRYFQSHPLKDVETAAMTAFRKYFIS